MRVLIVDDNIELADNVAELLADEGYDVEVANSARQALCAAETSCCWDAALLDVRMDGMDGVDLLAIMKQRCPKTRWLMMTAFCRDDRLQRAMDLGAACILAKPFRADALIAALRV